MWGSAGQGQHQSCNGEAHGGGLHHCLDHNHNQEKSYCNLPLPTSNKKIAIAHPMTIAENINHCHFAAHPPAGWHDWLTPSLSPCSQVNPGLCRKWFTKPLGVTSIFDNNRDRVHSTFSHKLLKLCRIHFNLYGQQCRLEIILQGITCSNQSHGSERDFAEVSHLDHGHCASKCHMS